MTAVSMSLDPTSPGPAPANLLLHPLEQIRRQVAASLFDESHEPSTIGRFQVLRVVGAGGMGVVYAARDPQLDRTVALKLLHPAQLGLAAQQRLLREAQAMARLQHPNVLAVYDAGVHASQVWIAMEYEGGGTLGDWLRAAPRRWLEVLEVLVQAGRGLAAAHGAGLVHRDFKPANVLVGGGRIRISDFGLARLGEEALAEVERTADEHVAALAEPMTRTGAVLGTPAYMAPEQLAGGQASARSDQFAFCVVLFEALHGHRPFRGDNLAQLCEAFQRGALVKPARPVPRRLQAVLERGLQVDPERRFPSMDALLAELARVREERSWYGLLGALAVGGAALMYFGTPAESSDPEAASVTDSARFEGLRLGGEMTEVWNPDRARALQWKLPQAREEVDALLVALDAYAERWREVQVVPPTGRVNINWTRTCLVDRLQALDDLLTVAEEGTRESAKLVGFAPEFLPDVADCVEPSSYNTLTSQGLAPTRRAGWRARLLVAGGYAPRALRSARLAEMGEGFAAFMTSLDLGDPRLDLELDLAGTIQGVPHGSDEPNSIEFSDPRTGETVLHLEYPPPPRVLALKRLRANAERSAAAGFADVAARAWAGVAELLEAGPHSDHERVAAWDNLRSELTKLPVGHRLRRRLAVDLAVFAAAHARHVDPGGCKAVAPKSGACEAIAQAVDGFATALRHETDTGTRAWLAEQLAQAREFAGDVEGAAAARRANPGEPDTRTPASRGYLDFAAGTVVPYVPSLAEAVTCTYDHARCEVEPAALAGELEPVALLEGAWFMPRIKGGQFDGFVVMNARNSDVMRRIDLREPDRILAVEGVPVVAPEFAWDLSGVLNRGRLALTIERDGVTLEREFVLRRP
ncbi:serine/threonine-protein kinase [Nannocystis sp. SCPEA4]|uniref:serine/threonine-protein kinase n=1 Tax=Nannocystis sp. SCPEA4 TaxID=2996787 RepID=UPI002271894D|nr:serine/threonine-protein kinase [Nannocystis sp. SCPEA4]MCY1055479.1 serine/threonine-protein kinase [Nannocystis sp. SCPEA4]